MSLASNGQEPERGEDLDGPHPHGRAGPAPCLLRNVSQALKSSGCTCDGFSCDKVCSFCCLLQEEAPQEKGVLAGVPAGADDPERGPESTVSGRRLRNLGRCFAGLFVLGSLPTAPTIVEGRGASHQNQFSRRSSQKPAARDQGRCSNTDAPLCTKLVPRIHKQSRV